MKTIEYGWHSIVESETYPGFYSVQFGEGMGFRLYSGYDLDYIKRRIDRHWLDQNIAMEESNLNHIKKRLNSLYSEKQRLVEIDGN